MAVYLIDKIKPKNGGSFPMVDAQDVLMPDGTRLSEATLGGEGGMDSAYFVTTYTSTDNVSYTADHSFAEQLAAFQSGKILYASLEGALAAMLFVNDDYVQYSATICINGGMMSGLVMHGADDAIECAFSEIPILTAENVNGLIDEKLGVIENGTY